jgi:hypothetical protein
MSAASPIPSTDTSTSSSIAKVQRSDGWIETTWNNMSDPGALAVTGTEEQKDGEPPPLAGAGVVVCVMG